jgi:large subunit ribosomal protein L24
LRNFLTFVAVALVTALTVALVAPPLINWSARPEMVGRAIALRIGAPVRISGPISLRLLPTPYLQIADVAIGSLGTPWLTGRSMRFEFGVSSLFGGKIELDDVAFDHPTLKLGPRFAPPAEGRLAFGHIRATQAEIRVERVGASPIVLHDVTFDGAAASARGPFRGDGEFALSDGGRAHYHFATEPFADDGLSLRGGVDSGATRLAVDGRLALAEAPSFTGTATLDGETSAPDGRVWPWRIDGALTASGDEATIADGAFRLGEDARDLEAEGRMTLRFGAQPALDADLKAKTLDIDALLRRDKETFVAPARAAAVFAALGQQALGRDAPAPRFSLKLQARAAFLGARTLTAPEFALSGASDGPMPLKFSTGLPGRGRLALDGSLELGPAPILRGRGAGDVADFAALGAWIGEDQPDFAARLTALAAALPQSDIAAEGDIELSAEGYSVRGLKLGMAASRFDGSVVYRLPTAERRGRLYLDLASPAVDIDAAPNVEAGLAWLGSTDLDFRLQADALRVARVGLASVSGGSLSVRAVKDGQTFALQELSLANFGGASIEAQGEATPARRWARVKLDAGRLSDFANLLARAAPNPLTRWLLLRADDLGGAKASFEARREGPPLQGPFGFDYLKSEGAIAGARFALTLSQAPAPVDAIAAQATVDSADAGGLLRKLGLKLAPGPAAPAALSLSGNGRWDRGFDGQARLSLAGANLTWSGAFRPEAALTWLDGPLTLKSADVLPALVALGLASAGAPAPADLSANFEAGPDGARWSQLNGSVAGSHLHGELAAAPFWASPEPRPAAITGALALDRASLGALLSFVLGRPAAARPGAVWPESKFAPALLTPPSLDIALTVGGLDLGVGIGRATSARLQMDRNRLALADASALLNGGKLSGRLDIRRSTTQTTASGALIVLGVGVERAGLSARLDASLDFAGAGDTAAALIGGLAGAGRVKIGEAKIPRLDPQALAHAFAKIEQAQGAPPDEKKLEGLIGAELDKAALTLSAQEGALALSSGALRFGPLIAGSTGVSATFDLTRLSLALDASESYAKVGRFWSGPAPQVEIAEKVAPDPATRKIDAEFLGAGLAAEAIARESDRIENFEADVRERAMFNRKRKAQAFLDRRQAEIAAYFDAQARRRLMEHYLGPYAAWAASRSEPPPSQPPADGHRAKDAAGL